METKKKNYNLYGPQHSWDMNYHLLEDGKKIEYLIDICDVTNDINEKDEYLHIETLLNLTDIDEILMHAWKKKTYISDTYLNLLSGTKEEFEEELVQLHKRMQDSKWLVELAGYL